MLKKRLCAVCSAAAMLLTGCAGNAPVHSFTEFAMDTYMTVSIYDGGSEKAASEARAEILRLDSLWSPVNENSDIYRLDHSGGKVCGISSETAELLGFAVGFSKKTNGAFNPAMYPLLCEWGFTTGDYKIPSDEKLEELLCYTDCGGISVSGDQAVLPEGMEIDLGAVGKGEAGDRITDILVRSGVRSALLDLGGNIQCIGSKPDGSDWRIALKSPFADDNIAVLNVSGCCVITSGGYERCFTGDDGEIYWHILDPRTGKPAKNGIISATVIGSSGRMCDALSTALFVMGEQAAREYYRENGGFDMILITDDNRIIMTKGVESRLKISDNYSYMAAEVI